MATDLVSGQISFAGLGSGTDFNALIEGLMSIEQRRVTSLETWKATWEEKVEEFKDLNSKMLSLRSTLKNYDTVNEFLAKSVSTTDSSVLTASADGDAESGNYQVEIGSLASNDVFITSSGVSDLNTSVVTGNSNFTFSYGGESYTVSNIAAGTTLAGLVNTINTNPESSKHIRASTIFDGTNYHLQLAGRDLGADNQLVISNTGSILFGPSDFQETQDASNSQMRINGFPSAAGGWLERDTNTITDVIDGLTLNLKEASPGSTVKVTVATDTEQIKENIRTIVDEINEVRQKILDITAVDDSQEEVKGSILTGNYGIQIISQKLNDITAQKGVAFDFYNDETGEGDLFSALSQVGITTDAEKGSPTYGLLIIKEDSDDPSKKFMTLNYALDEDPDAVARLFSDNLRGESKSADLSYIASVDGMTSAGVHEVEIITSGAGISSATINGEAVSISADGLTITGQQGTEAAGLQVRLTNFQPNTTITGDINLKDGKVNELIDELSVLTKEYNEFTDDGGPLNVLIHNYGDIMDSIDKKILFEENRIAKMEYNYKLKFSRLDATLNKYSNIQTQLSSQISQLPTS
jgi:flagellar hook-associated protein 2